MAADTESRARYECDIPGRAYLWTEWIASYRHLHLRSCTCSNRNAYGESPYDSLTLLTPGGDGIDHALACHPVPALYLSEDGTLRLKGKCSEMILCLVELGHECINHGAKERLLHHKRANTLNEWEAFHFSGNEFKKVLTGFFWGMWIKRLLQFASRNFHGSICKRL